jgi:very-short-patch-repair endonuclease
LGQAVGREEFLRHCRMTPRRPRHRDNVPAARNLRARQTRAEEILWARLRDRRLAGLKFRRQHPVGPFVADFCCPDRHLVIELDGAVHLSPSQRQHDAEREALLTAAGYTILRFPNSAVHDDLAGVLATIRATAEAQLPSPPAAPPRTGAW